MKGVLTLSLITALIAVAISIRHEHDKGLYGITFRCSASGADALSVDGEFRHCWCAKYRLDARGGRSHWSPLAGFAEPQPAHTEIHCMTSCHAACASSGDWRTNIAW